MSYRRFLDPRLLFFSASIFHHIQISQMALLFLIFKQQYTLPHRLVRRLSRTAKRLFLEGSNNTHRRFFHPVTCLYLLTPPRLCRRIKITHTESQETMTKGDSPHNSLKMPGRVPGRWMGCVCMCVASGGRIVRVKNNKKKTSTKKFK